MSTTIRTNGKSIPDVNKIDLEKLAITLESVVSNIDSDRSYSVDTLNDIILHLRGKSYYASYEFEIEK